MIDLKLNAPGGIRGEFHPIQKSVPSTLVCEHLPLMSQWMYKITVVRSRSHQAGCHNPLLSYTGYDKPLPAIVSTRDTYPPSIGSVVESLRQERRVLPDYVYMPSYLVYAELPGLETGDLQAWTLCRISRPARIFHRYSLGKAVAFRGGRGLDSGDKGG
jgi:hypothetical protein